MTDAQHRAELIAGLHALATFLESYEDADLILTPNQLKVGVGVHCANQERFAKMGAALGLNIFETSGEYSHASRQFGQFVAYQIQAMTKDVPDPEAAINRVAVTNRHATDEMALRVARDLLGERAAEALRAGLEAMNTGGSLEDGDEAIREALSE